MLTSLQGKLVLEWQRRKLLRWSPSSNRIASILCGRPHALLHSICSLDFRLALRCRVGCSGRASFTVTLTSNCNGLGFGFTYVEADPTPPPRLTSAPVSRSQRFSSAPKQNPERRPPRNGLLVAPISKRLGITSARTVIKWARRCKTQVATRNWIHCSLHCSSHCWNPVKSRLDDRVIEQ